MTMMIIMTSLSIIFMFISHPLSMGFILLIQTLIIAMWTGYMSINFWYSYILFIIMVGGMLILFIYMTSIASNEKFKFNFKIMITMLLTTIMMSMFMLINNDQMIELISSLNIDINQMKSNLLFKMSLNKFLMMPLIFMSLTIISYLFIALIAVSKITNTKMGPLRKNM
uniref:NADH dehydrogenase subunit 6 n=1 Tax=Sclerotia aquatilis TaxID=1639810 RepID=UPI002A8389EE|nr:NADH dehydrogenase subunit 6 [Sclerotia aquatilis]WOR80794.1 NADH dehydrogenase subunit 6 [Sclerotia aquatilis]